MSSKERFILPQKDVWTFMQGNLDIEQHFEFYKAQNPQLKAKQLAHMRNLAHEVNSILQVKKMQPMIRTSYYRCAFQLGSSNALRISLDTSMTLLNEFQGAKHGEDAPPALPSPYAGAAGQGQYGQLQLPGQHYNNHILPHAGATGALQPQQYQNQQMNPGFPGNQMGHVMPMPINHGPINHQTGQRFHNIKSVGAFGTIQQSGPSPPPELQNSYGFPGAATAAGATNAMYAPANYGPLGVAGAPAPGWQQGLPAGTGRGHPPAHPNARYGMGWGPGPTHTRAPPSVWNLFGLTSLFGVSQRERSWLESLGIVVGGEENQNAAHGTTIGRSFFDKLGKSPMSRTATKSTAATDGIDTDPLLTANNQPGAFGYNVPWCRVASDKLTNQDIVRFPYAILEVKLSGIDENPEWVQDMLDHCDVTQVYKFSKFQHAMAFLHQDKIEQLPHWFEDFVCVEAVGNSNATGKAANRQNTSASAIDTGFENNEAARAMVKARGLQGSGEETKVADLLARSASGGGGRDVISSSTSFNQRFEVLKSVESLYEPSSGLVLGSSLKTRRALRRSASGNSGASSVLVEPAESITKKGRESRDSGYRDSGAGSLADGAGLGRNKVGLPRQTGHRVDLRGGIVTHKLRNMKLVEPKVFFANERTFLHYVKHGFVLLAILHFLLRWQWRPTVLPTALQGIGNENALGTNHGVISDLFPFAGGAGGQPTSGGFSRSRLARGGSNSSNSTSSTYDGLRTDEISGAYSSQGVVPSYMDVVYSPDRHAASKRLPAHADDTDDDLSVPPHHGPWRAFITDELGLSPAFAGVTLAAFGQMPLPDDDDDDGDRREADDEASDGKVTEEQVCYGYGLDLFQQYAEARFVERYAPQLVEKRKRILNINAQESENEDDMQSPNSGKRRRRSLSVQQRITAAEERESMIRLFRLAIQLIMAPLLFSYFVWCYLSYRVRLLRVRERWSVKNKEMERQESLYIRHGPLVLFAVTLFLVALLVLSSVLGLGRMHKKMLF